MIIIMLMTTASTYAELYLMFKLGDNEDRGVPDAGTTLAGARDGIPPTVIDANADRYVIHLPGATMNTLSGSAVRVDDQTPAMNPASMMADVATESAAVGSATKETEGDTGWVEYSANAASLMLFSPDDLEQESDIRFEPARVFLRRFANGSVFAAITGEDGEPPPEEAAD